MGLPQTNLLLESLPQDLKSAILAHCQAVSLPVNTVLFEPEERPRHVHFVTSGIASVVTEFADGRAVEVGLVGREGVAECLHLLGPQSGMTRCFMQIGGAGLKMDFKLFEEEFMTRRNVSALVLRYVQYSALLLSQLAACNRLHEIHRRLARWLLMAQDKVDEPTVHLTQEFLAQMLGCRRTTVTEVAGNLQKAGLLAYSRGRVQILDRERLVNAACECYPVAQRLFESLYKDQH